MQAVEGLGWRFNATNLKGAWNGRFGRAFSKGMMRPLLLLLLLVCAAASLFAPLAAAEPPPVAADEAGVAIGGYDPVAYFEAGRAVPGAADHSLAWRGAEWRFASRASSASSSSPTQPSPCFSDGG